MTKVYKEENSTLEYVKQDNGAKNLIILFHGYGASMLDLFDLHTVIRPMRNFDWIFPNGHLDVNLGFGMLGKAWFPVDMAALERAMQTGVPRDFSALYSDEFDLAIQKAQSFLESFKDQYDNIIIGGFSQGAMVTSYLTYKNSKTVKGYLCFSGTLLGKKQLVKVLETSEKVPFFQSHGLMDQVLDVKQARDLNELLNVAGMKGELHEFRGAHEIPMSAINKATDFINGLDLSS